MHASHRQVTYNGSTWCDVCGVDQYDLMAESECRKVNLFARTTHTRDPLLVEREKHHGDFRVNAELWKKLTDAFEEYCDINTLSVRQQLALSMIFGKIARLAQKPRFRDHWKDIAGYAKLALEDCAEEWT